MSVDLSREVRLFFVDAFDNKKTGPLDHARIQRGSREDFRKALRHEPLDGRGKHVVGCWVPVDAKTREQGATFASRGGREFDSPTQVGRHLENVVGACASVFLDIDDISREQWDDVCATIRRKGWSGEAYSSASCTPDEISVRLHLHLDRELVSGVEVANVRRSVSQLLGNVCDKICFQQASVYYLPATKGYHFVEHFNGPNEIVVDSLPAVLAPVREMRNRPVPEGYAVSADDMARAQEELAGLASRIRSCATGLRKYTALATMTVGQRVAAGVLHEDAAIVVLSDAVRYQNATHGDATCTVEGRIAEIVEGIADGKMIGPALPADDELAPKDRLVAASTAAVDFLPLDDVLAEAARLSAAGETAILALPPGVGKTNALLQQIATGHLPATIYTPSHALAMEHRSALIAMGVPAADIHHEMSALYRPPGGVELCARSVLSREAAGTPDTEESPFAKTIHQNNIPLQATVCLHCPLADTCPARTRRKSEARVILAAHSAYRSPEPGDVGTRLLVLDEEPEPFEQVKITKKHLKMLTGAAQGPLAVLSGAEHSHWTPAQVEAAERAAAEEQALAEEAPRRTEVKQAYYVRQAALALRAGRPIPEGIASGLRRAPQLHLAKHVARMLAERPWEGLPVAQEDLAAVQAVLRLGTSGATPVMTPEGALTAVVPTDVRRDVLRGDARLLSATPTPGAYGDVAVYAPQVQDGCAGVTRRVLYHCDASNTSLKRDPLRGLERAAKLLAAFPLAESTNPRVLVVTHKLLIDTHSDALRAMLPGKDVVFRHFGNVAGSNHFQEGGEQEVSAVITIGDYYANRRWLFEHLSDERGLTGEDALAFVRECGRKQIAQELAQAHGRARDPRRTLPLEHVHIGREVPEGWDGRFERKTLEMTKVERRERLYDLLLKSLDKHTTGEVATECGVSLGMVHRWRTEARQISEDHRAPLTRLAA